MEEVAVHKAEALLYFTLLQLTVVVLAGRMGSWSARRMAQSAAVGEIIVGILLGPSLFGWVAPGAFDYVFRSAPGEPMEMLAQIGLIFLMFQIGLEFDFSQLRVRRNRRTVLMLAVACVAAPFALGLAFGWFSAPMLSPGADPLAAALFVATAFSITALPILGRILMELDLVQHPLGVIAISAAAINDVVGWVLLAMVTAFAVAHFELGSFALNIALIVAFAALCWWGVRPLLKRVVHHMQAAAGADAGGLPDHLLGLLLAVIFIGAMSTYKLGIFAIFGGFMAGVLLYDEAELVRAWKQRMGQFVTVFFLPIFFTYTGLRTDIGGLDTPALWGWCALVVGLAVAGKFVAGYAVARISGWSRVDARILGVLMNTRALMELIIINVGFDLGVISQNVFTMLVIMAIVSTVMTTPLVRRWLGLGAGWAGGRAVAHAASSPQPLLDATAVRQQGGG